MKNYGEFLATKTIRPAAVGFSPAGPLPAGLFPWQARIVRWALRQGRAAIFAGCGLGKTAMQLAWADAVARHAGRPVLILAPLAVGPQTVREGEKFGVQVRQIGRGEEAAGPGVYVTNYQKVIGERFAGSLDQFAGVVLDESSILKSYMGKTKRLLIDAFRETPYRLCCTATPAPNDHMELGNHSEFLGVLPSNDMLARWFVADQANCGHYRLKGHAERDFWRWVCSWAVCVGRPSDVGGDDAGFDLPPLTWHNHVVKVDAVSDAGGDLFRADSLTATTLHREMRRTAADRAAKVAELVNGSEETWVVWCNTNYEADELTARLPGCVEVRGSDSDERKEGKLNSFSRGECRVIVSKPSVCGFGLNWQHCRNVAFVGLSYSFEQLYQAVRRVWRFGQTKEVHAHLVTAETEGEVLAAVREKERGYETMGKAMREAMRHTDLDEPEAGRKLVEVQPSVLRGDGWECWCGDAVQVTRESVPPESVHLSVFSPPFAGLYIYSDALQDMGNSQDDGQFFDHFAYLVPELFRVTVPGRLCVVHCKDLPRYAGRDGTAGLKDFPGEIVRLFSRCGWSYHSRVCIWKCPVVERERTNNNGLLYKTFRRDTTQVRQGMADYLVIFRRPPREEDGLMSAAPLVRDGGLSEYVGTSDPRQTDRHPSPFARKPSEQPALSIWQRYAEPVWWDVDQMDTLNEKLGREDRDERHICPLQLGVIRRCVQLWSDPGETVLSPFAGIGSEVRVAVEMGRKAVGVELKRSYFDHCCRNARLAEEAARQRGLFDQLEGGDAA